MPECEFAMTRKDVRLAQVILAENAELNGFDVGSDAWRADSETDKTFEAFVCTMEDREGGTVLIVSKLSDRKCGREDPAQVPQYGEYLG